jgi:hypothetical protein
VDHSLKVVAIDRPGHSLEVVAIVVTDRPGHSLEVVAIVVTAIPWYSGDNRPGSQYT